MAATNLSRSLNPRKALIFRITHRDNLPWLLANGLHCRSAVEQDPGFVTIGNRDLIGRRATREVPTPPGGTLSDYAPFYFTPASPMLLNIVTGRGVPIQHKEDILVLVCSLPRLQDMGVAFVFTDRHAYLPLARFSNQLEDLPAFIPWSLLQAQDFSRDPEDPEKAERYQAEALVHHYLPASALLGIGTYTDDINAAVTAQVAAHGLHLKVVTRPNWFFP
ncbi:type II toxin-antitoxin system toxin DNA ADP-ribosyl transferase DarT [Vreelandella jeotgali]|uniref:type II toxin-antitoxin system toxin DNA ADP-ribosyl transferase DarT n=1 Tax=Vreelandella jeotgali TaxID=553386 RepID=UPI00034B1B06|nr:DUF4433 domain-containing protein [Halomonas jeotgali]